MPGPRPLISDVSGATGRAGPGAGALARSSAAAGGRARHRRANALDVDQRRDPEPARRRLDRPRHGGALRPGTGRRRSGGRRRSRRGSARGGPAPWRTARARARPAGRRPSAAAGPGSAAARRPRGPTPPSLTAERLGVRARARRRASACRRSPTTSRKRAERPAAGRQPQPRDADVVLVGAQVEPRRRKRAPEHLRPVRGDQVHRRLVVEQARASRRSPPSPACAAAPRPRCSAGAEQRRHVVGQRQPVLGEEPEQLEVRARSSRDPARSRADRLERAHYL